MTRRFFLTIILFFILSPFAHAANRYQIDMIIFRYQGADFQGLPGAQIPNNAMMLGPEMSATNNQYTWLAQNRSKLQYRWHKLAQASNIQLLGLYSWTQPIYGQNIPLQINLQDDITSIIKLSRGTFINVELIFISNNRHYVLARRIKNNELNYFDNAMLGALLQVTPIK